MKKTANLLALLLLTMMPVLAQTKKGKQMEKTIINPWEWQDQRSYVQAVEVKNPEGTLYVSGQTAISANGISSNEDMASQIKLALKNLELVITSAGYECKGIVRLNIYTTNTAELWPNFSIIQDWIAKHGMQQATTLLEVKSLFETLKVELEATVVR
ncbi:enamine deaminase RidA (YjgF/YER057c/UK114 family) [Flavobacterium araucananum]|nr:enamine deaminase RidA (YjgF/YER057c/UK114 family) [Flavobacterium araucananum]